jgi:hypothetical protein
MDGGMRCIYSCVYIIEAWVKWILGVLLRDNVYLKVNKLAPCKIILRSTSRGVTRYLGRCLSKHHAARQRKSFLLEALMT